MAKKKRRRELSRPRRILRTAIRTIVVVYGGILLGLMYFENWLVYPGAYREVPSVSVAPPDIEPVSYRSTDGLTLTGQLLRREGARRVMLMLHGNGEYADGLGTLQRHLSEAFDATVLVAEYRGYRGPGSPSERGLIDDGEAARRFLCQEFDLQPDEITLYGRSLGGGVAVALAARAGAAGLVLECTFDRMVDVAWQRFPWVPVPWLMKNRYESASKIKLYRGPLVQIHSDEDEIIPIENGRKLFRAAPSPSKTFIELNDVRHGKVLGIERLNEIAAALSP